jgi:ribosomal protein L40E
MMSSATSTEPQPLQPWQFFTLAGLVGATIVVFLSEGQNPAGIILLSLIVFGAAAVGVAAWRTFSPLAGIDEPAGPQIFGGRTRAALEREKALVLRSIKDLEFDHAMGKVSDKDFAEMGARLRARAAGLIRQLDSGTNYRQAIQAEIDKRVGGGPNMARPPVGPPPATGGRALSGPPAEEQKAASKLCLSCCTPNDPDARFCKGCGYQLGNW